MAKRRTGSKGSRREPIHLSDSVVKAGTQAHIDIRIARLPTGTWLSLPVSVVHGARPGPTVWLSAAVHGDELNGIPIIRDIVHRLDPSRVAGTLLTVPIVNVFGLTNESRYLPDRRDLNRSFPGSRRGSLAAQIAHLLIEHIVSRCDMGIDFHTGSDGRTNLPQIRCDARDPALLDLARVFAPPVIVDSKPLSGSLRAAASKMGIKTLLYEAGEDNRFDDAAIRTGIDGSLRVLHHLGIFDSSTPESRQPVLSRRTAWVRARRSGLCQMHVNLGDRVEARQRIAVVFDAVMKKDSTVRARNAGIVIGRLNRALVHRGAAIAHIAELADS